MSVGVRRRTQENPGRYIYLSIYLSISITISISIYIYISSQPGAMRRRRGTDKSNLVWLLSSVPIVWLVIALDLFAPGAAQVIQAQRIPPACQQQRAIFLCGYGRNIDVKSTVALPLRLMGRKEGVVCVTVSCHDIFYTFFQDTSRDIRLEVSIRGSLLCISTSMACSSSFSLRLHLSQIKTLCLLRYISTAMYDSGIEWEDFLGMA